MLSYVFHGGVIPWHVPCGSVILYSKPHKHLAFHDKVYSSPTCLLWWSSSILIPVSTPLLKPPLRAIHWNPWVLLYIRTSRYSSLIINNNNNNSSWCQSCEQWTWFYLFFSLFYFSFPFFLWFYFTFHFTFLYFGLR